jgi:hypothetical protein
MEPIKNLLITKIKKINIKKILDLLKETDLKIDIPVPESQESEETTTEKEEKEEEMSED